MVKVFVSMWELKTDYVNPKKLHPKSSWRRRTLSDQIQTMTSIVDLAHTVVRDKNGGRPPAVHLFTSPEFTWANHAALEILKPDYTIRDFALDNFQKDTVAKALGTISAKHEGLLLVPGSVFTKLTRYNMAEVVTKSRSGSVQHTVQVVSENDMGIFLTKPAVTPKQPSHPGNQGTSVGVQGDVAKEMEDARQTALKSDHPVQDLASIRNIALLAWKGGVTEYYKMFPDECEYGEAFSVFTPGNQQGSFEFGELRLALEVCADHASGALRTNLQDRTAHVHLIVSAYVDPDQNCMVQKEDGLFVLADTKSPGVWIGREYKKLEPVANLGSETAGALDAGRLKIYAHDVA